MTVYVWAWESRPIDTFRKGQPCVVLARGAMNSCLVRFPDGAEYVTSRNALRRMS